MPMSPFGETGMGCTIYRKDVYLAFYLWSVKLAI